MGKELEEQYIKTHEVMRPPKIIMLTPEDPEKVKEAKG